MGDNWMTPELEAAALEGWASNGAVPLAERLQAAMQVIAFLRSRAEGHERALYEAHKRGWEEAKTKYASAED